MGAKIWQGLAMPEKSFTVVVLVCLAPFILASCGLVPKDISTPYTGNPLAELVRPITQTPFSPVPHQTYWCKADKNGTFGNTQSSMNGVGGGFDWGEGGGCILQPIREVWARAMGLQAMRWGSVKGANISNSHLLPGDVRSFDVDYLLAQVPIFGDVKMQMKWLFSLRHGTPDNPLQVLINYKKVSGTPFIGFWEGTILLDKVNDQVTAVTMRNEIHARQTDAQDAGDTITDYTQKLRQSPPNWTAIP